MRALPLALALALALALVASGCVANVKDLKDRLQPASTNATAPPPTAPLPTAPSPSKPPVARMDVFGADGALLYQSTFAAEDMLMPMPVNANESLTLVGTDSEALAPGASIARYHWDVAGDRSDGPKTTARFTGPGKYPVNLTVTDTLGGQDSQVFVLAVEPQPYNVTTNLTTGPVVGAMGAGQDGTTVFSVGPPAGGQVASIQNVRVLVPALDTCDTVLTVILNGKTVGTSDNGGLSSAEAVDIPGAIEGKYSVDVSPGEACAAKDGVPVTVTVTYLPVLV
jgi:hypothetical protein